MREESLKQNAEVQADALNNLQWHLLGIACGDPINAPEAMKALQEVANMVNAGHIREVIEDYSRHYNRPIEISNDEKQFTARMMSDMGMIRRDRYTLD